MSQAIELAEMPASGCALIHRDCEAKDRAAFLKLREPFDAQTRLGLERCRPGAETCGSLCGMGLVRAEAKGQDFDGDVVPGVFTGGGACDVNAAREPAVRERYGSDRNQDLPALGLPDAHQARGLLRRASHSLWNGAIA